MEIIICKICALCAGCTMAINTALNTVKTDKNVVLFKEVVHNKNVNLMLKNSGVEVVDSLANLPQRSTVILRAHGEPKTTYEYLEKNNITYKDCTCFNVKKIHEKVEEFSNKNYNIIIIGKHGKTKDIHPEVLGTIGWCAKKPVLIESEEDLLTFKPQKDDKFYLVCQTTFNIEKAENLIELIIKKCKENLCEIVVNKSLCKAQKNINEASVNLAKMVNLMIVVGGKNSSNSIELYKNVQKYCRTIFLEDINLVYEELNNNNIVLNKNMKIGLTAGASTLKEELYNLKYLLINN